MTNLPNSTTLKLNDMEAELVSTLLLQFARSVDHPQKTYNPDATAYPIMLSLARSLLEQLDIDYSPAPVPPNREHQP